MSTPYRFTRSAIDALCALQAYLSGRSGQAGAKFSIRVQETIDRLSLWPESGRAIDFQGVGHLSLRITTSKGFRNYIIVHSYDGDTLTIEHVFMVLRTGSAFFLLCDVCRTQVKTPDACRGFLCGAES